MTRTPILALLLLLLPSCSLKDKDAVSLPPAKAGSPEVAAPAPLSAKNTDAGTATTARSSDGVLYTGTIEAHRRSTLSPKISSTVAKVHVREGNRVREGDPLVTFDLRDVTLRLRQARAALEGAKIQREAADDDWQRVKALVEGQAVTQAQFDGVEFKKRGAEVGVVGAEIAVEVSEKAVNDSVIRAPYDGVIVRRMVNEGDYATTMPPTSLLVIEELGVLDLRVHVASSEISRIHEGDPVTVSFPSLGQSVETRVTRIVASIDARTRNFPVIVEIPNPEGVLLPGLFAEARFGAVAAVETKP